MPPELKMHEFSANMSCARLDTLIFRDHSNNNSWNYLSHSWFRVIILNALVSYSSSLLSPQFILLIVERRPASLKATDSPALQELEQLNQFLVRNAVKVRKRAQIHETVAGNFGDNGRRIAKPKPHRDGALRFQGRHNRFIRLQWARETSLGNGILCFSASFILDRDPVSFT